MKPDVQQQIDDIKRIRDGGYKQDRNGELREPSQPAIPKLKFEEMSDLVEQTFPPLKWIVPGWIAEGCTILAGKPKIGKSSLLVAIAHAVRNGGTFLGQQCEKHGVMYIALEDTRRTLNERGRKLSPSWEKGFLLSYQCKNLDNGLIDQLRAAIADHPDVDVIFIDVLARVRGASRPREPLYDYDGRTGFAFTELANETGKAIVLCHHAIKGSTFQDVFDQIHGSTGLIGSVSTGIVIAPIEGHIYRFYVRGREVPERDMTVEVDLSQNTWELIGNYEKDPEATTTRERILATLRNSPHGYPMGPKDIAQTLGIPEVNVRNQLKRLVEHKKIIKLERGAYAAAK